MSGILQNFAYGRSFGLPPPPTTIGGAYGGGFYAGRINVSGSFYNLVVAPKASGESASTAWGVFGFTTGVTSVIDGPTNSATLAAMNPGYINPAAIFCEGLTIGGYSDWYLPAKNELEVLYYFLKPTTTANDTSTGSNNNAVSPEPISTNYTTSSPAQTSASDFISGGSQAFGSSGIYWSSTEFSANSAWIQYFNDGLQYFNSVKPSQNTVRAVRRIPV